MSNGRRWGVRAIASLLIFIIAAVITPVALVGHWGHRTVVDATQYLDTVGPLVDSPEVQEAISTAVSDAIIKQVDVTSLASGLIGGLIDNPTVTSALTAPIAAGVNNLIKELVHTFVASSAFRKIWITTNEVAQRSLVALLEGKPNGPIQVQGDTLVLDISSMLTAAQGALVANGVDLASKITIPQSDSQIVLAQSAAIGQIQFIYELSSPILQWFPLLLALLFGLSVALARNRSRTVLAVGIAMVGLAGASRILMNVGETVFIDQLKDTVFAPASTVFWNTFFNYLLGGLVAVVMLGIFIGLAGWFSGVSRPATKMRTALGRGLHSLGSGLPGGLRRSVRAYAPVLRWVVAIVMLVVLTTGAAMEVDRVILITLLTAGLFTLIEILSGPDRIDAVDEPGALTGAVA
ncbi:MAG: hypothetical protein F2793_06515 [Actinobacteria bacterium]|uniref:Unannotated protein n=1 Tax=freshwater metagenome TaxID=449393 RepID=A0A6J7EHU0_9ZZZZ|nr:hypothetical protein [Actinomycetota bacterium]